MRSLVLLTGPNGGGKSSLLRSLCATALLGICGLMVPADSAIIPHFDSVMLHMKAYDSPSDGKSSFQIEMSELRSVVAGASPDSLVLVDEICRGTETEKGTCIAASIVEHLDQIGCLGFVSTHLHTIFELPLTTKNTVYKAMGTENADGRIKPTWKLVDGICRESLAFETALKEGLPEKIIRRAGELYLTTRPRIVNTADDDGNNAPSYSEFQVGNGSTMEVDSAVTMICRNKLTEFPEVKCVPIGPREEPPPSTVGTSCIYILFRPDKKLYVGQTDDLAGRVRAHRAKEGMQNATFIYVVVPGKSLASKLETLLINQLPPRGFQLVNRADGKHRNFGTSSLSRGTLSLHQ